MSTSTSNMATTNMPLPYRRRDIWPSQPFTCNQSPGTYPIFRQPSLVNSAAKMWRVLAVLKRNLQNMRKSPQVADESMFRDGNGAELAIFAHDMGRRRGGWGGFSVIYSIVRAPVSLFSCFAHPHINGADGVWASGELARISEMNHLMISDGMRYAILM